MKRLLILAVATVLVLTAAGAVWYAARHFNGKAMAYKTAPGVPYDSLQEKLKRIGAAAKQYAGNRKFNTQFCFLADISIASGKQRFFVYDLKNNNVVTAGLVTHGRCNQDWLNGRKYGNSVGCGCTSLGRYKVGNAYKGRFGLAYKLYGLDTTNSNAYGRFVVLHSHQCVPENQVDPNAICQSDGCPTVSPVFLQSLSSFINSSKQPVLLWMFD